MKAKSELGLGRPRGGEGEDGPLSHTSLISSLLPSVAPGTLDTGQEHAKSGCAMVIPSGCEVRTRAGPVTRQSRDDTPGWHSHTHITLPPEQASAGQGSRAPGLQGARAPGLEAASPG